MLKFRFAVAVLLVAIICSPHAQSQQGPDPEGSGSADAAPPPNIVFILVDDTGWNALDVRADPAIPGSGSPFYRTPNTSKLAFVGRSFFDGVFARADLWSFADQYSIRSVPFHRGKVCRSSAYKPAPSE